jgi:hypothetical protein
MFGSTFFDKASEDSAVKGLSNRLPLFFRVRNTLQCRKKLLPGIDDFNGNTEVSEKTHDLFGFSFPHETVFDKDGFQLISQGTMPQHGDGGRIDASRQSVYRRPFSDSGFNFANLFIDELFGVQLLHSDLRGHVAPSFSW